MITAGLGDILGKYTCLLDWKMAHIITGEYYCSHIADMVCRAGKSGCKKVHELKTAILML